MEFIDCDVSQQAGQRNFDLEQYDGSCRQPFPFVKWIDSTIEPMGEMNILDKNAQPDFEISDAQSWVTPSRDLGSLQESLPQMATENDRMER